MLIISKLTNQPGAKTITSDLRPERSLGFLITDVSHLLRRSFNRRVQALGLSQAQWRVLVHLLRSEGLNQAALAERLEIQPITLTRLLDRMESAGWVERRVDPDDRRALRLYLTAKAEPVLAELHSRAKATLEEALAGFKAGERRQLTEALLRVKQNLSVADSTAAGGTETRTPIHVRKQPKPARRR